LSFKKPQTQRRFRVESKCANFAFQRLELWVLILWTFSIWLRTVLNGLQWYFLIR
jgi:hypothetical protein